MSKVAGVVVLYNPEQEVLQNVISYAKQVDELYIIDNSEEKNLIKDELRPLPNIKFLFNECNIGIAAAINKAAIEAINNDNHFLLTMDQDSQISPDLVKKMIHEFEKNKTIGLIAPFVVHLKNPKLSLNHKLETITIAMTSGSILSLDAFKKIGGYQEDLFIDYVDHEYCLRLKLFGFQVLQLNSVYVYHKLGNIDSRFFLFKKVFPTNHSPLRLYYRTRNRFYVRNKYGEFFPEYIKRDKIVFLKEVVKILLFEKNKIKKVKMIIKGYIDYKKDKFGKLPL